MYRVCEGWRVVLASGSPRRRQLLGAMGLEFQVLVPQVAEEPLPGEPPQALARRLAKAKAEAAGACGSGVAVLGADTLVVVQGQVLGKPRDEAEAKAMLGMLSGRWHEVCTGYCLITSRGASQGVCRSQVFIRGLSPAEIAAYVATGEPMDKAGAYAAQGIGAGLIQEIKGSYTNVVGLPLAEVLGVMLEEGIIEPRG